MPSRDELLALMSEIRTKYGDWCSRIQLPHGLTTLDQPSEPHYRLIRVMQIVADLLGKELSQCRVIDLGCLDGFFSIEFARHGAKTVGIEVREANIKKAEFCRDALGLDNLEFFLDDVRNVSAEKYGHFDIVLCSGILYHLEANDAIRLLAKMYEMCGRLTIIDTHFALDPQVEGKVNDLEVFGSEFIEHAPGTSREEKIKSIWASIDNDRSFWFTRSSLVNLLSRQGYASVYENYLPVNVYRPARDRGTFVCVKGSRFQPLSCPLEDRKEMTYPGKYL